MVDRRRKAALVTAIVLAAAAVGLYLAVVMRHAYGG